MPFGSSSDALSQDPGEDPACQLSMPVPILWIGSDAPPHGLRQLLAERDLPSLAATRAADLGARLAAHAAAVVCFAPGSSPRQVSAALASLRRDAPRTVCGLVLHGAGDLAELQELIDDDRLFYAAPAPLSDRDAAALIESAAAALRRRTAPLPADDLRRLAQAETSVDLAGELGAAAARTTAARRGHCVLFDRERQALWAPAADPETRHSPGVGLISFVFRTGLTLSLEAAGSDPRFDRDLDAPAGEPADRFLAAAVRAGDGEVAAVLAVLRAAPEPPFAPAEIAALEALAAQVAPYLTSRRPGAAEPARAPSDEGEPPPAAAPRGLFRRRALSELERPTGAGAVPLLAAVRPGRRRIRYVPQAAAADCGAACLAMTLGWHGKTVSLEEVRGVTGSARHGLDGQTLLRAASHFGLRGRGVQVQEVEELALLDPGSILHWGFNHFVVLERVERRGAWILDPGYGRRFVARAELDRALTGVALTFEPGADFVPGGRKAPLLRRYLRRVLRHNAALARVLGASLLLQLGALAIPLLTGLLVDRVIPGRDHELFWVLASGAAALAGFTLIVTLVRARTLLALRTRVDAQLSFDFLEHLVRLPFSFFQQRSAGDLLTRLASNATIREILTSAVLSGALDGLMVASYLALLLVADPRLGLLVAALAAIRVGIVAGALRRRRRLTSEALEAQAASQGYQVQLLAGIEALKACGAERRAVDTWSHLFTRELNAALARGRLDALLSSLLEGLSLASPLAVLLYGAARVMAGDLTLGMMLSLAALASGFLAPLSMLVANAAQFQLLGSYLERLDDVLSAPAEPDGLEWPRPAEFSGRVALHRVSFRYGPLAPPALDDVSFEVGPGQLVAVVGPSGSGKSTLAGVVAGLLDPEAGRVLYDGRPLAELPRDWLRGQLAYVPQQSFLFGTSIRANIALQDPALPLERIVEAAKLAEIHDDISRLPMGYETVLADGGTSLSGGQRQRIALARALVADPKVLILDEATSALDAVTERNVQSNLNRLGVTRLIAAHRLSTIRDADWILVLDRGRIVEAGTHETLAAEAGIYRQLIAAQLEPAAARQAWPEA
jgi:ABC-type bacteriocin/lantibiotic exporter with double-glycine peptidase domain